MATTNPCSDATVHDVKRNDTGARFEDHLRLNGVSVDLAGGQVEIVIQTMDGRVLVDTSATILQSGDDQDVTEPNVAWTPGDGDLDHVGLVKVEWRCQLAGGTWITFPRKSYHQVRIWEVLNERAGDQSSSSSSG